MPLAACARRSKRRCALATPNNQVQDRFQAGSMAFADAELPTFVVVHSSEMRASRMPLANMRSTKSRYIDRRIILEGVHPASDEAERRLGD